MSVSFTDTGMARRYWKIAAVPEHGIIHMGKNLLFQKPVVSEFWFFVYYV